MGSYCTRCQQFVTSKTYLITRHPSFAFADVHTETPPEHVTSCKDCLTDKEVAEMLVPAVLLVVRELCFTGQSDEAKQAARYVMAMLECQHSKPWDTEQKARDLI